MTFLEKIQRVLNVFETGTPSTDYRSIFLYNDGNGERKQVTLGRGFTSDGGALQKVLQRYIDKNGAKAEFFKTKIRNSTPSLVADKEFLSELKGAFSEQAMRDAQDEVFNEVYLQPALIWAEGHGFKEPLSQAVIIDSYLHSGSIPDFLTKRFPEKKPSFGGDEKLWIMAYLKTRRSWLAGHSRTILRSTVYRPDFFLAQVNGNNWNFDCPLEAHDTAVC